MGENDGGFSGSSDDKKAWEDFARHITKLPSKSVVTPPPVIPQAELRKHRYEPMSSLPLSFPAKHQATVKIGDLKNMDRKMASALRKGNFTPDATLDLHGYTIEAAHTRFMQFIQQSYQNGQRFLIVITGRGKLENQMTIRNSLPSWLEHGVAASLIVGITQAQPKHGGRGAFYILLRRQR